MTQKTQGEGMKKISLIAAIALASSSLGAASLEEAIKGVQVDGSAFIRHISNTGADDGGSDYIMRLVLDLSTGNKSGFNFGGGLFYHYGGTPTFGTRSDGAVDGSRSSRSAGISGGNVFGVSTLWAQYGWEAANTTITGGKLKLATPISSATTDRGVGALATSNPVDEITIALGWFDSWSADNQYIGGIWTSGNNGLGASASMGNNLSLIGVNGNYDNFAFKAWYFNIGNMANSLFGEFNIGKEYSFTAQVAYTDVYNSATLALGGGLLGANLGTNDVVGKEISSSRGLYTLQVATKPTDWLLARAGFVGSFGSGYGVALNNTASFNIAGKWWYDNFGNGRNGFSWNGQGGIENTHINLWYLAGKASVSIVDIGLDIAGISGKNQFAISQGNNGQSESDKTFYEITPSVDINIAKGAKLSAYYAMVFGQVDAQRFWAQVSYKF